MATINAIGSNKPIEVTFGGTGAATLTGVLTGNGTSAITANAVTQHGVLIGGASNAVSSLGVAATGSTLMGTTGADPSFTGSPSFSGSVTAGTTITATLGAITATSGDVVLTSGNLTLAQTSSSSIGSIVLNGNRFMHAYAAGTDNNTFVGSLAGNYTLTTGSAKFNVALGTNNLTALTTGNSNTAIGYNSLAALTDSAGCTAVGSNSGKALTTTATANVCIGQNSLQTATTSNHNTCLGASSLASLASGSDNTCLGFSTGSSYTAAESSNILIGYNVNGTNGTSNELKIGNATGTSAGNINVAAICGITGKTSTSGVAVLVNASNVLGTTTSSIRFKENVQDMGSQSSDIFKLRPVTFTYKVSKPHVDEEASKLRQFGLIAEEVEKIMPDQVNYNLDGNIESVRYLNFIPMLINEIQKLRKELDELKRSL